MSTTGEQHIKQVDLGFTALAKAQVMTRDDSSGGWVPLGGGGMSVVGLRQRRGPESSIVQSLQLYTIYGQRLADHTVVLDCSIDKHLEYTQANPTFHHWKTVDRRFGLAFQTSTDAMLFERSVRLAIDTTSSAGVIESVAPFVVESDEHKPISKQNIQALLDETVSTSSASASAGDASAEVSPLKTGDNVCHNGLSMETKPKQNDVVAGRVQCEYVHFAPAAVAQLSQASDVPDSQLLETDEVSMCRTCLPIEPPSTSSQMTSSFHEYSYCSGASNETTLIAASPEISRTTAAVHGGSTSQLALPVRSSSGTNRRRRSNLAQLFRACHNGADRSSRSIECQEELRTDVVVTCLGDHHHPTAVVVRPLCVYCSEPFDPSNNRSEWCPDAPDRLAQRINRVACVCCVRALVYHCLRPDEEDRCCDNDAGLGPGAASSAATTVNKVSSARVQADLDGDPCACHGAVSAATRCKTWSLLAVLSLVVPCLWCYWPMTACHRCAVQTGCYRGRQHVAQKHCFSTR